MTRKILLTRGRFAVVDDEDFEWLNQWHWYLHPRDNCFYAARESENKMVYMHRLLMKAKKGQQIDHINNNGLDNRKANLRFSTQKENSRNCRITKKNTSGYKGVSWHSRDKVWHAKIGVDYKRIHLGYFDDPKEAAKAYDKKAKELYGEYAWLNFK